MATRRHQTKRSKRLTKCALRQQLRPGTCFTAARNHALRLRDEAAEGAEENDYADEDQDTNKEEDEER